MEADFELLRVKDPFVIRITLAGKKTSTLVLSCATVSLACEWHEKLSKGTTPSGSLRPLTASHANAHVINAFYHAFATRDWATMCGTYADDATFRDPVFHDLDAAHVRAMWKMFCTRSADLEVEFSHVAANDRFAIGHWDARYTFSKTGRRVLNRIDATFELRNGRILAHVDVFSFHQWSAQALGGFGKFAGWTSALNGAVSSSAHAALNDFMQKDKQEHDQQQPAAAAAPAVVPSSHDAQHTCAYVEHFASVSADRAWALVGSWLALEWVGVVRSAEGDAASRTTPPTVGAVRTLGFVGTPDTWRFSDKLYEYDDAGRTMTFGSVSAPLPLQQHRAVLTVREDEGDDNDSCTFEWVTTFSLADDAPEGSAAYVVAAMRRLQARAGAGLRRALAN